MFMRRTFVLLVVLVPALLMLQACQRGNTPVPATNIAYDTRTLADSSAEGRYTIEIEYPQFDRMDDADVERRINADLEQQMQAWMDSTRAQARIAPAPDDTLSEWYTTLDVDYSVERLDDRIASVVFSAYFFGAGAAHPVPRTVTYTYDLSNGERLKLADLFWPSTNHLSMLSGYAVEQLEAQAVEDNLSDTYLSQQIQQGAGPRAENFQVFHLTQSELVLTFNPYAVGPYAWGTREVKIPLTELQEVMRSEYVRAQ